MSGWGEGLGRDGLQGAEARIGALKVQGGPHSALLWWPIPFCLQISTKGGRSRSASKQAPRMVSLLHFASSGGRKLPRVFFRAPEGMLSAWTAHQITGWHCVWEVRQAGVGSGWGALPAGLGAHQPQPYPPGPQEGRRCSRVGWGQPGYLLGNPAVSPRDIQISGLKVCSPKR